MSDEYKDRRIEELDTEVMLLSELIQHLLDGDENLNEELKAFIDKRLTSTEQKKIATLKTQKQVLLKKVLELLDRLKECKQQ